MVRRHEDVARVFPAGDAREDETLRKGARHVLDGVHGEVGPPVEQRLLDLLHEESLAPDVGERSVGDAVAAGDDLQLASLERGLRLA